MARTVPPKPEGEAARTNPPIFSKVPLRWDGLRRGPELPEGYNWSDRTLEWWDMWRDSAQAMVMIASDWEAMFEAALLHDYVWKRAATGDYRGITGALQELRRKVAQYGATHFDRLNLRMEIQAPWMEQEMEVKIDEEAEELVDYLSMMKDRVADKQDERSRE